MRKRRNWLYVSLAVADLLVGSCVATFALVNDLMGRWFFGATFCRIWISLDVMCSTASIVNLSAIAFDRYMHVRLPFTYERWMNRRRMSLIVVAVWVLSIGISFIPIQLDWHLASSPNSTAQAQNQNQNQPQESVSDGSMQCKFSVNATYAIASSCVSFFVPGFCLVLVYGRLHQIARSHYDAIKQNTVLLPQTDAARRPPAGSLSEAGGKLRCYSHSVSLINGSSRRESVDEAENKQSKKEKDTDKEKDRPERGKDCQKEKENLRLSLNDKNEAKPTWPKRAGTPTGTGSAGNTAQTSNGQHGKFFHERKATITLGFLIGAFLTCWSPFFTCNVLAPFCSSCISDITFTVVTYLGYSNSALDPVAIFLTNNEFRRSLRRMVTSSRSQQQQQIRP